MSLRYEVFVIVDVFICVVLNWLNKFEVEQGFCPSKVLYAPFFFFLSPVFSVLIPICLFFFLRLVILCSWGTTAVNSFSLNPLVSESKKPIIHGKFFFFLVSQFFFFLGVRVPDTYNGLKSKHFCFRHRNSLSWVCSRKLWFQVVCSRLFLRHWTLVGCVVFFFPLSRRAQRELCGKIEPRSCRHGSNVLFFD